MQATSTSCQNLWLHLQIWSRSFDMVATLFFKEKIFQDFSMTKQIQEEWGQLKDLEEHCDLSAPLLPSGVWDRAPAANTFLAYTLESQSSCGKKKIAYNNTSLASSGAFFSAFAFSSSSTTKHTAHHSVLASYTKKTAQDKDLAWT